MTVSEFNRLRADGVKGLVIKWAKKHQFLDPEPGATAKIRDITQEKALIGTAYEWLVRIEWKRNGLDQGAPNGLYNIYYFELASRIPCNCPTSKLLVRGCPYLNKLDSRRQYHS